MPKPLKVLVVDDDPICLEILASILEELGHTVLTRESSLGTSAVVLQERPDVVLLDVNMPALSGDDLLQVIREMSQAHRDWEPIFIFVSGNDASSLDVLVQQTGARGAIEKSAGPEAMAERFSLLTGT